MKKIFTFIAVACIVTGIHAQTWNFNVGKVEGFAESYPTDKTNLDWAVADTDPETGEAKTPTWTLVSNVEGRYQTSYKTANEQLAAKDAVLEITKGLYFTGASGKFRIDVANNQFGFNGKDLSVRIKGLKAGQKVEFCSRSASNSALDRYFEATANLEVVEGFNVPEEGNPVKVNIATVKEEGDIVITSMVGGLNITYLTVYDVDGTEMTKEQVIAQGESYVAPREMTGTVVKESKTWICPQDLEKDAEISGATEEGVAEQDGLYLRGKAGSHSVKVAVENVSTTIVGEAISTSRVFITPSNGNFAPATEACANDAIKNATDMSLAVNIGIAGKLYFYLKARNISTEGRYVWIYKNGEKVLEKLGTEWTKRTYEVDGAEKTEADYELHEFDVEASGATFFVGGNAGGVSVAAVKFVKEGDATGISTVKTADKADNKWYNLAGQQVEAPTKGFFIHNGRKYVVK